MFKRYVIRTKLNFKFKQNSETLHEKMKVLAEVYMNKISVNIVPCLKQPLASFQDEVDDLLSEKKKLFVSSLVDRVLMTKKVSEFLLTCLKYLKY